MLKEEIEMLLLERMKVFNEEMNELKQTINSSIKLHKEGRTNEALDVLEKGTLPFWGSKKVREFKNDPNVVEDVKAQYSNRNTEKQVLLWAWYIIKSLVILTSEYEQANKRYFSAKEILDCLFGQGFSAKTMVIADIEFICQNFYLISEGEDNLKGSYTIKADIISLASCFRETGERPRNQKDILLTHVKKVGYILHVLSLNIAHSGRKGLTANQIKERIDAHQQQGQMPKDLEFSVEEIDDICSNMNMQVSVCSPTGENFYTTALIHSCFASVLIEHEKSVTE